MIVLVQHSRNGPRSNDPVDGAGDGCRNPLGKRRGVGTEIYGYRGLGRRVLSIENFNVALELEFASRATKFLF